MQIVDKFLVGAFLAEEELPDSFIETIESWYEPLVNRLLSLQQQHGPGLVIGINGAQGTGKSTLAKFLTLVLQQQNLNIANLSLDDFYLSHQRRAELADEVHPLFATRGVPGTHDLDQMETLLSTLINPESEGTALLPRFNKAEDDPFPEQDWESARLPTDIVLLEGWFVGLSSQASSTLETPINKLELEQDEAGIWRKHVNDNLQHYQPVFKAIDFLVMLKAPSFDCVYQWRALQEQKLATTNDDQSSKTMDKASLEVFIQHFERLTRCCLEQLPEEADLVYHLDEQHRISSMSQAVH